MARPEPDFYAEGAKTIRTIAALQLRGAGCFFLYRPFFLRPIDILSRAFSRLTLAKSALE